MGLVGRLGRALGPGGGARGAPSADFLSKGASRGLAATSCRRRPNASPRPLTHAHAALGARSAAPAQPSSGPAHLAGVKRALSTCTKPLHAPTAYANASPSTPPPPIERICARPSTRARRASPALRPLLPGTRPRKRRRGPCGPEVEKSSPPAPSGRSRCRYLPRRALQAWLHRHRAIRRRSASRNRPVAACGSNILARGKG